MSGYLALLYQANGLTHCSNIVKCVQKVCNYQELVKLGKNPNFLNYLNFKKINQKIDI